MKKKENNVVEVIFILDRSGSMEGRELDTIGGFNANLAIQKKEEGEVIWSTILFDDQYEVIHDRLPIKKVKPISEKEYYVRGCTALLDAIGITINHIANEHKVNKKDVVNKTIFIISTDGLENASEEYNYKDIHKLISKYSEKEGWEFIFLGANMDAIKEASKIGIRSSRAASFMNDEEGIEKNYSVIANTLSKFRKDMVLGEDILDEIKEDYQKRS